LVPEELANVGRGSTDDSAVGSLGSVLVNDDVQVSSAASIVARELGGELDNTISVRLLEATESSVVQVAGVCAVTVHVGFDTGVDTSGVGAPDIEISVGERLAGGDIDELGLKDHIDTGLLVTDI
jgi:hypothetical protein